MATNVEKIKSFIENNFKKVLKEEALQKLGERSKYIGASDIASCIRASYLNKKFPVDYDMKTLLRFERGHQAEEIVLKMFKGLPLKREVEFENDDFGFPVKVHLDFVIFDKNKKEINIVEVKSSSDVLTIHSSYIMQVNFQRYIAQKALEKSGWKVKGCFVLVINMNTGDYNLVEIEEDKNIQNIAIEKAKKLAHALKTAQEPEGEEQLYCSSCPHRASCPTFSKGAVGQSLLEPEIEKIKELEAQKKALEAQLKEKKEKILQYLEEKELSKVKVGEYIVSIQKGSSYVSLDTKKLKNSEPELYEKLISQYGKKITRSSSLKIK